MISKGERSYDFPRFGMEGFKLIDARLFVSGFPQLRLLGPSSTVDDEA